MRGTESDHVLFLVDGVRVGSATSGLTALQDLPLELIERIEIVRGPRSSLYGSEAIGGVIQIFTRGGGEDARMRARIGAGSTGLRETGAGLDVGNGRSEEHTSELQSLMRTPYAHFVLKNKNQKTKRHQQS